MASSSGSSPSALLLSFLAGGAAVLAVAAGYLEADSRREEGKRKKMTKHPVPSFLEAMYLYEKEAGIGEELPSTPRADDFRMPAEWESHSGCVCSPTLPCPSFL
jgi:hypothetical protein